VNLRRKGRATRRRRRQAHQQQERRSPSFPRLRHNSVVEGRVGRDQHKKLLEQLLDANFLFSKDGKSRKLRES
jgi:hypothetical protein